MEAPARAHLQQGPCMTQMCGRGPDPYFLLSFAFRGLPVFPSVEAPEPVEVLTLLIPALKSDITFDSVKTRLYSLAHNIAKF